MPIRFRCHACRQVLEVASRKAGSEITCPKCGANETVPDAGKEGAGDRGQGTGERGQGTADSGQGIVDGGQGAVGGGQAVVGAGQEAASSGLGQENSAPVPPPVTPVPGAAAAPPPVAVGRLPGEVARVLPSDMILFPRTVLYIQGLLFVLLGAAAFGVGYWMGRGDNPTPSAPLSSHVAMRVMVEGKITYNSGLATTVGDEDAVVLFLPEGNTPDTLLTADGIRPFDPPPPEGNTSLKAIETVAGAYARAGADGQFWLSLPDEGRYRLLIVSRHTARRQGNPDEADLAALGKYLAPGEANRLLGKSKYVWKTVDAVGGALRTDHDFGLDRQ